MAVSSLYQSDFFLNFSEGDQHLQQLVLNQSVHNELLSHFELF